MFSNIVRTHPRENLHWVNLVTLLLVMERYEDAAEQIEQLGRTETLGGNRATYEMLKKEIDVARTMNTAHTNQTTQDGTTP